MTRIIHFADSHEEAVFPRGLDKRVLGYCNSHFKRRFQHKQELLDQAIQRMIAEKPDAVLFTGDAVSTADPAEFAAALPHFLPLIKAEIPLFCTAGNHDVYVKNKTCRAAMESFYSALGNDGVDQPRCVRIGAGNDAVRLLLLPESCPTLPWLSCGYLSAESVALAVAEAEKTDEAPLILAGHFPIRECTWRRGLRQAEKLRQLLAEGKIAYSLCGHVHKPAEEGREVIAGSVTRYGVMTDLRCENGAVQIGRIQL